LRKVEHGRYIGRSFAVQLGLEVMQNQDERKTKKQEQKHVPSVAFVALSAGAAEILEGWKTLPTHDV
jgi:hypothetical protein